MNWTRTSVSLRLFWYTATLRAKRSTNSMTIGGGAMPRKDSENAFSWEVNSYSRIQKDDKALLREPGGRVANRWRALTKSSE